MKDPTSVESQEENEESISRVAIALAVSVCAVIIRRLSKLKKNTTYVDLYSMMPKDIEEINDLLVKARVIMADTVDGIFDNMAVANDTWAKTYYEAAGITQVPAIEHQELKAILGEGKQAAQNYIAQTMRTSVIGIVDVNTLKPMEDAYRSIVSRAITDMVAGTKTYQQSIAEATSSLAKNGLKVYYPSGVQRDLYGAMRTNIMDGYRDTMMNLRIAQGKEFGADGYEVSAHSPCAPDHLPYQGRKFRQAEWRYIQEVELRHRPIESGANCRHMVYPIKYGITDPALTDEKLEKMRKESEEQVTITGLSGKELTMTRYEATQYQRNIENSLRQDKTKLYLREQDANTDKDELKRMRANIRSRSAAYKRITEEAGLTTRMERTRAYTLD